MESIFNTLYQALYGNDVLTLLASFMWGVMSILLSPCHLSSIPLVLALLLSKQRLNTKQTFLLSSIFALGILVSIAIIGVITALLGRMLGDLGSHANAIFGIALIIGGLLLMDVIPLGSIRFQKYPLGHTNSVFSVLLVGLLFGLALGPCTFAFIAPVLGLVLSTASTHLMKGIFIMLAYGIGHCMVIIVAGTSLSLVQRWLNWSEGNKASLIFKRICAALVVVAGVYLLLK